MNPMVESVNNHKQSPKRQIQGKIGNYAPESQHIEVVQMSFLLAKGILAGASYSCLGAQIGETDWSESNGCRKNASQCWERKTPTPGFQVSFLFRLVRASHVSPFTFHHTILGFRFRLFLYMLHLRFKRKVGHFLKVWIPESVNDSDFTPIGKLACR